MMHAQTRSRCRLRASPGTLPGRHLRRRDGRAAFDPAYIRSAYRTALSLCRTRYGRSRRALCLGRGPDPQRRRRRHRHDRPGVGHRRHRRGRPAGAVPRRPELLRPARRGPQPAAAAGALRARQPRRLVAAQPHRRAASGDRGLRRRRARAPHRRREVPALPPVHRDLLRLSAGAARGRARAWPRGLRARAGRDRRLGGPAQLVRAREPPRPRRRLRHQAGAGADVALARRRPHPAHRGHPSQPGGGAADQRQGLDRLSQDPGRARRRARGRPARPFRVRRARARGPRPAAARGRRRPDLAARARPPSHPGGARDLVLGDPRPRPDPGALGRELGLPEQGAAARAAAGRSHRPPRSRRQRAALAAPGVRAARARPASSRPATLSSTRPSRAAAGCRCRCPRACTPRSRR
ncbi:hypothetical protein Hoch_5242 [Haliangium ochraceum DSM 14365]|uniref:Uncharacterized protein n=1 Tax=Haliangium ochraceum (strain DSM 14365 / JCM 11303 / SMP-2) TaxID=502025 RepID=D0LXH2_HALO1|nr:hypothetical protein Hoch_5242 [Haliangium ochraceum DSM 14365]